MNDAIDAGPMKTRRVTIDVPYYVTDEQMQIGNRVRDMLGGEKTYVVVRIEPALIVVDDEGELSSILAHLAEVIE